MSCGCCGSSGAGAGGIPVTFDASYQAGVSSGPQVGLERSWWWLVALLGGLYVAHRQGWL